jgi:hypothetical protein
MSKRLTPREWKQRVKKALRLLELAMERRRQREQKREQEQEQRR